MRIMKHSKIANLKITAVNPDCSGSMTIDWKLLDHYDILPDEQIHVLGVTRTDRAITYAMQGKAGEVCCNGGLANIFEVGDIVNIVAYEVI